MTKRPADAIDAGFILAMPVLEHKPIYVPELMNTTATATASVAPVPLNSYCPEKKKPKVREFRKCDTETDEVRKGGEIKCSLRPDLPSLVKFMHPSIVSGGFSLGLEKKFCEHMPAEDCEVILENEEGLEYRTKYLAGKRALSGGWRGFSIAHKLTAGDVCVFQLLSPCKMKVYIVRCRRSPEETKVGNVKNENSGNRQEAEKYPKPLAMVVYEDRGSDNSSGNVTDESVNGSPGSGTPNGIQFSHSNISFKEVESFEDFHIVFDGLVIDCEFTRDMRVKYYELCRSQGKFLHENLLVGINCKLAAGTIIETVSIADASQAASPATPKEDVSVWIRTLKAVEGLGMSVQFLRERLNNQGGLVSEPSNTGVDIGDALQAKLLEVQEAARKFHAEIEAFRTL